MPVQGYTPNRNLIKIAAGSTDNWDAWYNQTVDLLDEPSILYKITAAENLSQGEVAAILDDGAGAKKAYLAASGTYTFGDPLGVATETATAGNPVHLALAGRVQNNGWSFGSPDKLAYLSASGTVTTTQTSAQIGYVLSSTAIYFRPGGSSSSGGQTNTVAGANGVINSGDNVDAVLAPTYGSSANTVCEGNDSRLHTQNTDQGTNNSYFEINYTGSSARLLTTGLTVSRDFTFPDAATRLIGESAAGAITADHDYSGGTLRAPTNAGAPSGANDEGDVVFDTVNDELFVGLGASAWKKVVPSKNRLINGAMNVWQRGTSFNATTTPANNDDTYLVDRWLLLSDGNDIVDVSRGGVTNYGFRYNTALSAQTINKQFGILQVLERIDSEPLIQEEAGVVSLSFYALTLSGKVIDNLRAAVLSWNGAEDAVTSDVVATWGATPTWATNWTAENTPGDLALTAGWQRFKIENIPIDTAGVNNLAVFIWTSDTTIALTDEVRIMGVQLEAGPVVTAYDHIPYADELLRCKRYYQRFGGGFHGTAHDTTRANIGRDFPVEMRATPTVALIDTSFDVIQYNTIITSSGATIQANYYLNSKGGFHRFTGFSGLTAARITSTINTTDFIEYTAEL